jgi:hypothetical protein
MTDPNARIAQIETEIHRQLAPEIADWTALADTLQTIKWDMFNVPAATATATTASGIAHLMCARITNEMRAVILLTERGYALQALASAATILEVAFTIAFIGDNTSRATRWFTHDVDSGYVSVRDAMLALFRLIGRPDSDVDAEYRHYTQLCTAKHGNPQMFRRLGIRITDNAQLIAYHGPYYAPEVVHTSRIAMWFAVRYMLLGLLCTNMFHVPSPLDIEIEGRLTACRERMETLRAADVAKYETPAATSAGA